MPSGKLNLKYSPDAQNDLWKIGYFIVHSGGYLESAHDVISSIRQDIKRLKEYPELGTELKKRIDFETDYRMLISGNYNVFYRRMHNTIYVIRIIKGSQDWLKILFA